MLPGFVVRGRPNPLHWKFAARLRKARRTARINAEALSVGAGLSKGIVSGLETGVGVPRVHTVERIASALKLSPGFLAYGFDAPWEPAEAPRCGGLAARTYEARSALGISLREADRRAGRADGTLREFEAGTMPGLDTIEDVAKALGVSPAWLAFGEGPREFSQRRTAKAAPPAAAP